VVQQQQLLTVILRRSRTCGALLLTPWSRQGSARLTQLQQCVLWAQQQAGMQARLPLLPQLLRSVAGAV
jgi:hypothetical protein